MFTKKFNQLSKGDAMIAGGKGASLGEMTQVGIPVPGGYVVLSAAFDYFLERSGIAGEIKRVLKGVDIDVSESVDKASMEIRKIIMEAEAPHEIIVEIEEGFGELDAEYVAVRSSATAEDGAEAAWAGQLESYLDTTSDKLIENVRKCWASLFTPRAIFYRIEKGFSDKNISVAVVVQKMVASEVSGVAFSVHPVTENRDQMIIEAGYGLGEAIVSGSITPDSYVVSKSDLDQGIIEKNISSQGKKIARSIGGGIEWTEVAIEARDSQKLSDLQIIELSKIIIGIENHYGFPCDIEWALEAGNFYIVQSRPITTL